MSIIARSTENARKKEEKTMVIINNDKSVMLGCPGRNERRGKS